MYKLLSYSQTQKLIYSLIFILSFEFLRIYLLSPFLNLWLRIFKLSAVIC